MTSLAFKASQEIQTALRDIARWIDFPAKKLPAAFGLDDTDARSSLYVLEVHVTLSVLRQRLSPAAFDRWLDAGSPSRRQMIVDRQLDRLEMDVHHAVFAPSVTPIDLSASPEFW